MAYLRRERSASASPPPKSQSPARDRRSRSLSRSRRSRSRSHENEGVANPGNNLYVKGLSTRVTGSNLESYFNKEGKVVDCHLVIDPHTKESRGFAFITMETLEDADRCIKHLHRTALEGRLITVEKAKRKRGRTPTPGKYHGVVEKPGGRDRRRSRSFSPRRWPERNPNFRGMQERNPNFRGMQDRNPNFRDFPERDPYFRVRQERDLYFRDRRERSPAPYDRRAEDYSRSYRGHREDYYSAPGRGYR